MFKSDQISLSPALNLLYSLQSVTEGPQASTSTCSQYQMIEMKRVTNLDWEVTSHRSQVTRSRHIWTDFRARAVSFGRKILLWASIMFAQRLTICEIDAKFSIFLFPSSHPWHYRQVPGKVVLTWRTVQPPWSYGRYGAVSAEDITSDTFSTQAVEAEWSQLGNVSLQMMMERGERWRPGHTLTNITSTSPL